MNDLRQKLLAAFAVEHREHLEAARVLLDRLERADWRDPAGETVELHRRVHSLKGAARAVDLKPIETLSHRLESLIERVQKGTAALDEAAARQVRAALDAIEDWVAALGGEQPALAPHLAAIEALLAGGPPPARAAAPAPAKAPPAPVAMPERPAGESLRIDAAQLDGLLQRSGEILTATSVQDRLAEELGGIERQLRELARQFTALVLGGQGRALTVQSDRHAAAQQRLTHSLDARLQTLANEVGQLSQRQRSHALRVGQLGRRLDAEMRRARMVPASDVLGDLRRMARDLAAALGKQVRVDFDGLATLADRDVLQQLKDPALHLLRNAVDHGIEPAAAREAAGKPREGLVRIALGSRGGRLSLTVEDDGRGVDVTGVARAAVARGLLSAVAAAALDEHGVAELLLQPGFSTAAEVTELSGRGMGLSIVERAVARLQGELRLMRRAGGGTVVAIAVPISVLSARLALLRCGAERFAVPAHGIGRVLRVRQDGIDSVEGRQVLLRPGRKPLRLVPLAALLGRGDVAQEAADGGLLVVVLEVGDGELGLVIDAAPAVFDGVVRDLGRAAGDSDLVSGGVVMPDGAVVPVLNVAELIAAGQATPAELRLSTVAQPGPPPALSILVVDDSITTRTLERSILEANGYRVRLSVDGFDALEQLRAEAADLVIADIEMPRLDGFGLLQAMKADEALRSTPVILVTSRDNQEDRRRGLGLGADAYVVKQRFDQHDLLETIGQIL